MPLPDTLLAIKLLLLLLLANGTPVILKLLLGPRLAFPLDAGIVFFDHRPLFGASKTLRGVLASAVVTAIAASFLGFTALTGALFALASLTGDLISSFTKRRLGLSPGKAALGVDQLPESLLPLLVFWQPLGLDIPTTVTIVVLFFICELVLTQLLCVLKICERPY